jgi:hypothetical protein
MNLAKDLRQLGFSERQIATATIGGKPISEVAPETKQHRYGRFRSKWEAVYAAELDAQLRAGEILQWEYEPRMIRLTEGFVVKGKKKQRGICYTPDFVIWLRDWRLKIVEIKGQKRAASINSYKMAVSKFPHIEWVMLTRKDGKWQQIM